MWMAPTLTNGESSQSNSQSRNINRRPCSRPDCFPLRTDHKAVPNKPVPRGIETADSPGDRSSGTVHQLHNIHSPEEGGTLVNSHIASPYNQGVRGTNNGPQLNLTQQMEFVLLPRKVGVLLGDAADENEIMRPSASLACRHIFFKQRCQ